MVSYILSIDQGTTSTRVIIFDPLGHPITTVQKSHVGIGITNQSETTIV